MNSQETFQRSPRGAWSPPGGRTLILSELPRACFHEAGGRPGRTLSRALGRGALVRAHWGAGAAAGIGSAVQLRFVLALPSSATKVAVKEEGGAHGDLHIIRSAREGPWYVWKVFGWLRHCIRALAGIRFVAIADDDAYVALGRLVADLRAVAASGRTRVVYAAFEWFSWHRNTGRFDTSASRDQTQDRTVTVEVCVALYPLSLWFDPHRMAGGADRFARRWARPTLGGSARA